MDKLIHLFDKHSGPVVVSLVLLFASLLVVYELETAYMDQEYRVERLKHDCEPLLINGD